MNVTGLVRIDLSPHVDGRVLFVDGPLVYGLRALFGDGDGAFELHIGDAGNVRWDARLVDLVSPSADLVVTGTNVDGVQQASRALRRSATLGAHSDLVLKSLPEALVSHVMALNAGLGITLDTAELIRVAVSPTVNEMRSAGKLGVNASTPTEKESS